MNRAEDPIFGRDGFGPAPAPSPELRAAWESAATPLARLRTGLALCQAGDLSPTPALAADLYVGTSGSGGLAVQHQHLVVCLLNTELATSEGWTSWCDRVDGDQLLDLAHSASFALTPAMLEWYLRTAAQWRDDAPFDWFEAVIDSIVELTGLELEAWDEDLDLDDVATQARSIVADAGAPYLRLGRPLTPDTALERAVAAVARSVNDGRVGRPAYLTDLATWTGMAPPRWPEDSAPSATDLAAVEAYAEQVAALRWRPGTKYFYGHDVDGGPGLGA